jgi:hypothetical protein
MSGDLEEFEPNEIANDAEDVAETRREIIRNGWTIPTAEDYDTLHGWLCALQWSFPELFAAYKGPGICSYYEFQNADAIEARYEKARLDDAKKL